MKKFLTKKALTILICVAIVLAILFCMYLFTGCSASPHQSSADLDDRYDEGYHSGYDVGFADGYDYGIWDGAIEGAEDFAFAVKDVYFGLERDINDERSFHPEEAVVILSDYINGKNVSKEELVGAVESIKDFYYDLHSEMVNLEDLNFDIDFD